MKHSHPSSAEALPSPATQFPGSGWAGRCVSHGWLDTVAVSKSALCAVHCLITPLLIIAFPILATTIWVHEDFHLWMVFLVIPTTSVAMFLGCRKHKDKVMLLLSALGLGALLYAAIHESFLIAAPTVVGGSGVGEAEAAHCALCASQDAPVDSEPYSSFTLMVNLAGGLLLAGAHIRNFLFCRRASCAH